jgi:hypothetical protein
LLESIKNSSSNSHFKDFTDIDTLDMPPQRVVPKQRTISFASTTSSTRQTPRRNIPTIQDYKNFERIDEPIQNPASTPKTPRTATQATQAEEDDTIDISDNAEDNEGEESLSNEEIEVDTTETPTRRNLQSTVIIRKRHLKRRVRKAREETT